MNRYFVSLLPLVLASPLAAQPISATISPAPVAAAAPSMNTWGAWAMPAAVSPPQSALPAAAPPSVPAFAPVPQLEGSLRYTGTYDAKVTPGIQTPPNITSANGAVTSDVNFGTRATSTTFYNLPTPWGTKTIPGALTANGDGNQPQRYLSTQQNPLCGHCGLPRVDATVNRAQRVTSGTFSIQSGVYGSVEGAFRGTSPTSSVAPKK